VQIRNVASFLLAAVLIGASLTVFKARLLEPPPNVNDIQTRPKPTSRDGDTDGSIQTSREDRPTALVEFGELDSVNIKFRNYAVNLPQVSTERLLDSYYELVEKARSGDGGAGFQIYQLMELCKEAITDKDDLDDIINLLHDTHVLHMPGKKPLHLSEVDLRQAEVGMRNQSQYCEGVTAEQKVAGRTEWLPVAADGDFLPAADRHSWNLYEDGDHDTAVNYFQKSWLLGNRMALKGLYRVYRNGSENIAPDAITAAAYLYLEHALLNAQHTNREKGLVLAKMLVRSEEKLSNEMWLLQPIDRERAISMARDFLVTNPQCCVDW